MGEKIVWLSLRFFHGFFFLWAFLDKVFGLGFATAPGKGWIDGYSPTVGFLKYGSHGPLKEFYGSIATNPLVEWSFMLGLLGVGVALILGAGVKLAGWAGAAMTFLMWTALIPPEHNPIIDEHLLESITLIGLAVTNFDVGGTLGLGKWWRSKKIVQKLPFLA